MFALHVDDDISLRLQDEAFAGEQYAVIDANREHIGQHLGWARQHTSIDHTRSFIRAARRWFAEGSDYSTSVFYQDELVGSVGLHIRDKVARKAEIGYWLAENFNGKGIMTRAVRAMIDYCFTTLNMNRLIIRAATSNPKSAAIPKRLGFQYEGILRQDGWVGDHFVDLELYSLLASDWTPTLNKPEFAWRVDNDIEIRIHDPRYAAAIFALTDANRAYLRRWMPWLDGSRDVNDTLAFIKSSLDQYANGDGFQGGVWYQGELVGALGYHYLDFTGRQTEIGYWLAEAYTGRGIMTRCVRAMTDYALTNLKLNRVEIQCAVENTPSCAIPERLGYTLEGIVRDGEWLYDHFHDLKLYAMLAQDWQRGAH
jgi:ribosomal-protein-serine acetyltransferase